MANLSAALEGASQGLDQLAERANQREMMEAEAMRAENLAQLNNYLTTNRQLIVTGARTKGLEEVADHRTAGQHAARMDDIKLQESLRGQHEAASQARQLSNAEHLQDNAFVNQNELRGRTGRVQMYRSAIAQSHQAQQTMLSLNAQMQKAETAAQTRLGIPFGTATDPKILMADPDYRTLAIQYRNAQQQYQSARSAMNSDPYVLQQPALGPGSQSAATMPSGNPAVIQPEGPGISDQPYPPPSDAEDQNYMDAGDGDDSDPEDNEPAQDPGPGGS